MNQFAGKSEAQLRFIIKDAAEAANAMRGHDPVAESKYLDQVNDATTELAKRITLASMAKTVDRLEEERKAAQALLFEMINERNPHKRGSQFSIRGQQYQVSSVQPSVRKLGFAGDGQTPDTGVWLSVHWMTTAKTWSRSTKTIWHPVKD